MDKIAVDKVYVLDTANSARRSDQERTRYLAVDMVDVSDAANRVRG